jgi:hypothetical protein
VVPGRFSGLDFADSSARLASPITVRYQAGLRHRRAPVVVGAGIAS